VKRFSKLGVEAVGVIGHTGKDLHPEQKRLTTLPFFKEEQTFVGFFEEWPAEAENPSDRRFGGSLVNLEKTVSGYKPDDASPWAWDLETDIITSPSESWNELFHLLKEEC
jgi:hypothetical protein